VSVYGPLQFKILTALEFFFDADPDPAFDFDADPDPASYLKQLASGFPN
jgi:hypothetical protein